MNRNGEHYLDGIAVMGLVIAILENMQGKIDGEFPHLMKFVLDELDFCRGETSTKKYKIMLL